MEETEIKVKQIKHFTIIIHFTSAYLGKTVELFATGSNAPFVAIFS